MKRLSYLLLSCVCMSLLSTAVAADGMWGTHQGYIPRTNEYHEYCCEPVDPCCESGVLVIRPPAESTPTIDDAYKDMLIEILPGRIADGIRSGQAPLTNAVKDLTDAIDRQTDRLKQPAVEESQSPRETFVVPERSIVDQLMNSVNEWLPAVLLLLLGILLGRFLSWLGRKPEPKQQEVSSPVVVPDSAHGLTGKEPDTAPSKVRVDSPTVLTSTELQFHNLAGLNESARGLSAGASRKPREVVAGGELFLVMISKMSEAAGKRIDLVVTKKLGGQKLAVAELNYNAVEDTVKELVRRLLSS